MLNCTWSFFSKQNKYIFNNNNNNSNNSSPLHKALQQAVQDVAPVSHELDIMRCAVDTLAVQNGPLEHVTKLLPRTEEIGPDEIHHAPVFDQVVLQRVSGQNHPPPGPDVLQGL